MRIGVYVDGFNLYFGGKRLNSGNEWKWLDVRKLVVNAIAKNPQWQYVEIVRLIYFTAEITKPMATHARQQTYLGALRASGSVDYFVKGRLITYKDENYAATGYYTRVKRINLDFNPLPDSGWLTLDSNNQVRVSHEYREEKQSDVNLVTHMLVDVLEGGLDAVVILTNDSDFKLPIGYVREKVSVGLINPGGGRFVADLKGSPSDGIGNHWWYSLKKEDYLSALLPDDVLGYTRPSEWF